MSPADLEASRQARLVAEERAREGLDLAEVPGRWGPALSTMTPDAGLTAKIAEACETFPPSTRPTVARILGRYGVPLAPELHALLAAHGGRQ